MSKFGTNSPDFDNGEIGYSGASKGYYIMSNVDENQYLFVSITFNGEMKIGVHSSKQAIQYFKIETYTSGRYLKNALSNYQDQINEMLGKLFKKVKSRVKHIEIMLDTERAYMLFRALLYVSGLKKEVIQYGYKIGWEETKEGKKIFFYKGQQEDEK